MHQTNETTHLLSDEEVDGEEAWLEWRRNPYTNHFFRNILPKLRERLMEEWAAGIFTADRKDGTDQLNARALGKVHQLEELMELTYEEITSED